MDKSSIERWFYCEYGWKVVTAQLIGYVEQNAVMRFRWGEPFRRIYLVDMKRIGNEIKDPRTFIGKLLSL